MPAAGYSLQDGAPDDSADGPLVGLEPGDPVPDLAKDVVKRVIGQQNRFECDLDTAVSKVDVDVAEAGHHHVPAGVDHSIRSVVGTRISSALPTAMISPPATANASAIPGPDHMCRRLLR